MLKARKPLEYGTDENLPDLMLRNTTVLLTTVIAVIGVVLSTTPTRALKNKSYCLFARKFVHRKAQARCWYGT